MNLWDRFQSIELYIFEQRKHFMKMNKTFIRDNLLVNSRATYPSDKLTIRLNNIASQQNIRWVNFNVLNLDAVSDVDILLEDSNR